MKSFKINDTIWRVGSKRGLMRLSSNGNWYYSKDVHLNTAIIGKILRCKIRLLRKRQNNNNTTQQIQFEGGFTDDVKLNMKRVDERLKQFDKLVLFDENKFDMALTKCFDLIIKPAIAALCRDQDMFQIDSDGEYIANSVVGDNLNCVMTRLKQMCPNVRLQEFIHETDFKLERMLSDFINDEKLRLQQEVVNPMTAAVHNLCARLANREFPSITLVRERIGRQESESYRSDLEKLQSSPIDEFNIEPVFMNGNLMNNATIRFIIHNVSLMAMSDPVEIMNELESETKTRSPSETC
jgi:hypothetical protein